MLDVIDDEHARLRGQRLGKRAGNAAKCAFSPRAERTGPVPRMALDHGALRTQRGRELGHEPGLAGAERAMQRDQWHHRKVLLDLRELALPADKRHRTDRGHGIRDFG